MQKIAVLSDIHGNYLALEQCIKYALEHEISTFIFLGDYVGELAYPQKTMELIEHLRSLYTCYFVKGNKEDYWINYQMNGEMGWKDKDSTTGSLLYTYTHLREKDISFFKELPIMKEVCIEGMPPITICHGSPRKVNKKMKPNDEETLHILEQNSTDIILCGHTHIQCKIEHNGRKIFNPGAVGVPLHSGGQSQFMILNGIDGEWKEEWISLCYDVEQTIEDLYQSGLSEMAPYWCRVTENLLRTGEVSHGSVLAEAMKYCKEETGECIWPNIPEQYWKRAVEVILGK